MTALAEAVARSFAVGEPERPAVSPLRALGRGQLSGPALLGQSIATTAPAASMVLLPVTMLTHNALLPGLVTIVVATLVSTLIAYCVAHFTRRLSAAGGLYTFVSHGAGPRAALTCGVGMLVKYLGSASLTMYHGSQTALALAAQLGITVRGWQIGAVCLGIAVLIGAVLVRGVRFAAIAILVVEACSLAFIIGLMLVSEPAVAVTPAAPDVPAVLAIAMSALFALAGFESATFFAPETRRPLVTVTRTVLVTPVLCGALFIFASWAAWSGHAGAVVDAYLHGTASGSSLLVVILLDAGLTCSWLGSSMASSNAASRLMYSMSVEGVLPRVLSRVGTVLRTPHVALVVIIGVVATVGAGFVALDGVPAAAKTVMRTALALSYILVAVSAVLFLGRIRELRRVDLLAGWIGSGVLAAVLACLTVSDASDGVLVAPATGLAVLVVGAAWYRYLRDTRPRSLTAIGIFDSPESADVLPGAGVFAVNARGAMALVGANRGER
ncbi:APC family permease [Nocardia neocaledoniensis]|uniref:Amino acid/polyamine/organocation transporter (APC superfamily) n=1 Tax=Nocardia neocaledoniensis TaxID=236511 RepID=A0A317NVI4_9NOCA|nr:APC family permease [Nocardia neocaledoniensis]PWV78972.1 amino acid/polyamine/organocation transporter (APC superfamily) [Nocardia neocaledoniensis]